MKLYTSGTSHKKLTPIVLAVVILVSIALAAAVGTPLAVSANKRGGRMTVVIDAGHGGIDGGVSGTKTGVKESELNLEMSKIVGEYFQSSGYNVVYTRKNDKGLYSASASNKKRDDMEKRAQIINKSSASIVISIHMNKYSSPSRRGAQVFFDKASESSREFADIVQDMLNRDFNVPDTGREYSALSAEKYILECTKIPVIIIECGFLSNPIDESNLTDPKYQAEFCYSIFKAASAYLTKR